MNSLQLGFIGGVLGALLINSSIHLWSQWRRRVRAKQLADELPAIIYASLQGSFKELNESQRRLNQLSANSAALADRLKRGRRDYSGDHASPQSAFVRRLESDPDFLGAEWKRRYEELCGYSQEPSAGSQDHA